MVENRRHPRATTSVPAHLRWTGPNRIPEDCDGTIRNYSRSGLRIESNRPVPPESRLTVAVDGRTFRGVVRYCAEWADRFVIGLEF